MTPDESFSSQKLAFLVKSVPHQLRGIVLNVCVRMRVFWCASFNLNKSCATKNLWLKLCFLSITRTITQSDMSKLRCLQKN